MEMTGQKFIPETREIVWKALNDAEILRRCIPGCQSLEKTSETEMEATATMKVGPVSAKFGGKVLLSELNAPESYRITGEGQGGVAGFAKGGAFIKLDEADGGTVLNYTVEAQVGGKLAQLGGRLIDATARKMAEAFFEKFVIEIQEQYHGGGSAAEPASSVSPSAPAQVSHASASSGPGQAAAPGAGPVQFPPHGYASVPREQTSTSRIAFFAALAVAVTFAFLWLTERQGVPQLPSTPLLSPDFGAGVQLILVAAVGYLFGRLSHLSR